jgi:hypothetical protein
MHIRHHYRFDKRTLTPRFPPIFGDVFPELAQLRNRLAAKVVDFGDTAATWGLLLLNLPPDTPAWSRTDALLGEKHK